MSLAIYLVSEKGDEDGGVEDDPKNGDDGVEDNEDVVGSGGQPEVDGRKKLTNSHKLLFKGLFRFLCKRSFA